MGKSAKISISMPEELLIAVEEVGKDRSESRSEFFRRAAENLLRQERERAKVEQYVQGYIADPESGEDEQWAKLGEAQLLVSDW